MKYNIEKFTTNTAGAYSAAVIATFEDLEKAKVNYHQNLATLHNASDVLIAVVIIVDEYGNIMPGFREVVDHTPTPEPEPEPEPENPEDNTAEPEGE